MNRRLAICSLITVLLALTATAAFGTYRHKDPSPPTPRLPWMVGRSLPAWTLEPLDGTAQLPMTGLEGGRPSVIVVGSTACEPTRQLMLDLEQSQARLAPYADIDVVWVTADTEAAPPSWNLPDDRQFRLVTAVEEMLVFPIVWVVGRDGNVVLDQRGYRTDLIDQVLAVVATSASR